MPKQKLAGQAKGDRSYFHQVPHITIGGLGRLLALIGSTTARASSPALAVLAAAAFLSHTMLMLCPVTR
jgi:hypothetical protein